MIERGRYDKMKEPTTEATLRLKIGIAGNVPDRTFAVCDIHRATIALRGIVVGHVMDYPLGEIDCLGIVEQFHDTELFGLGRAVMHGEAVCWHNDICGGECGGRIPRGD
jgi:hypothetical protein